MRDQDHILPNENEKLIAETQVLIAKNKELLEKVSEFTKPEPPAPAPSLSEGGSHAATEPLPDEAKQTRP